MMATCMLLPTSIVILASRTWQHHHSDEFLYNTSSRLMFLHMPNKTSIHAHQMVMLLTSNVACATVVLMTLRAPLACSTSADVHFTVQSRPVTSCPRRLWVVKMGCAKYDIFRIGMNLCPRRDQWRVKCNVYKIEKTQKIKSLEHGSAQTLSHDVDETVEHSFGSHTHQLLTVHVWITAFVLPQDGLSLSRVSDVVWLYSRSPPSDIASDCDVGL